MRAQSKVLTFLQAPPTIFGMAPTYLLATFVSALLVGWLLREFSYGSAALIGALGVFTFGVVYSIRARRKDPHCETVLTLPVLFYLNSFPFLPLKSQRILLAGQPLKEKRRKKRRKQ